MARTAKVILYGSGGVIYLLGLILILSWRPAFHYLLSKNIALTNGSLTEQTWIKNSVPIYFKVHMFNWSNPEQTLSRKEKANFMEIGPYTFKFLQLKSNTVWNENNTLTFSGRRIWNFVPEMSNGTLSDRVTNINTLAMSIGDRAKNMYWPEKVVVSKVLHLFEKNVYITKTVEKLLFEGYEDRMLDIVNYLKNKFHLDIGYLPDKFGWYFKKNITEEDIFNIHTGTDDINLLGKVHSWNYTTHCGVYNEGCDQVRGSLGDLWPMNISTQNTASIFISDFCGAFDLSTVGKTRLYDVAGVRFVGTEKTFDNGTTFTGNRCYCKNNKCELPSGVRDISDCVHGPIYLSFPHFYLADDTYRKNLNGIYPAAEKHQFTVTMQEDSGILMEIFARLQINVKGEPYAGMRFFSNVPNIMFPTLWFEEHAELPGDLRNELIILFTRVTNLLPTFAFIFMIIGAIIIFIGCIKSRFDLSSDSHIPLLDDG